MSTSAVPSASRGDITLQPSYFTSSLYVEPLRQDIFTLIKLFSEHYSQASPLSQPFALFKRLWTEQGWCWIHFKVFDGRARESFISATERLFLERVVETETPLARVVALFALYTFYFTQPSTSTPALHSLIHIAIPIDIYKSVMSMPRELIGPDLLPLKPYVSFVLSALLKARAFHILPCSELRPYNPSVLPREIFVEDGQESAVLAALAGDASGSRTSRPPKKKGRPSKREKMKKAREACVSLEKYLDKNTVALLPEPTWPEHPIADGSVTALDASKTTHILVAHPPTTTRDNYRMHKAQLLDALCNHTPATSAAPYMSEHNEGRKMIERANEAVLARLQMIDEIASQRGLEVGGEGGEKTGLARVQRAVRNLYAPGSDEQRGGIFGLLEGAGLDPDAGEAEGDPSAQLRGEM